MTMNSADATERSNRSKVPQFCQTLHNGKRFMFTTFLPLQNTRSCRVSTLFQEEKQAGTRAGRRHIQGSKIAKGLPSVNLQYSKIEKSKKNEPSGAPGPASTSPWRAERGTLPKLSTFLSQLKGGFWRKNKFSKKKSHNAEKLKGGPFGIFQHPF